MEVALALVVEGEATGAIDWRWWRCSAGRWCKELGPPQMQRQRDPDAKGIDVVRAVPTSAEE